MCFSITFKRILRLCHFWDQWCFVIRLKIELQKCLIRIEFEPFGKTLALSKNKSKYFYLEKGSWKWILLWWCFAKIDCDGLEKINFEFKWGFLKINMMDYLISKFQVQLMFIPKIEFVILFKCELLDPMRFYKNERLFNSEFLRSITCVVFTPVSFWIHSTTLNYVDWLIRTLSIFRYTPNKIFDWSIKRVLI